MTVNKQQFIERLAEKSGLEGSEAENQLDELIGNILKVSGPDNSVDLEGLGRFFLDKDGKLRFDPSKEFRTEINYRYAGMEPIELQSSRDTFVTGVEVKHEEEYELQEEIVEIAEEETPVAEPVEPSEETEVQAPSVEAETAAEVKKKGSEGAEKEKEKPIAAPAVATVSKKTKKKRDPILVVIGIILTLLLLAAAFIAYTEFANRSNQPETDGSTSEVRLGGTELPVETAVTEPDSEHEVSTEVGQNNPSGMSHQSKYGLMGGVSEEANDGFSIVIHSLQTERYARSIAEEWQEEGYRTIVDAVQTQNGTTVWRVSIGQFQSAAEAQENTSELPSPYNTENFIQRIRIN